MAYEQKKEYWQNEINPELELLQLRVDGIVDFVDRKVLDTENRILSPLFKQEKNWKDELIEIKYLLENSAVKAKMIEESDYSDVVGNFYNPLFLLFKRIEDGKSIKDPAETLASIKAKTSDFLNYLRGFQEEERKVA